MRDTDCEGFEYAPPGFPLAKTCWLVAGVVSTKASSGRIFAGLVTGGGSTGFSRNNLIIEMLDPLAPVQNWRVGDSSKGNLNGTFPALDCYSEPAKCAAKSESRVGEGLVSRHGWAVWDDLSSPRMGNSTMNSSTPGNAYKRWHGKNEGRGKTTDADLYFFGHGNAYKEVLYDFLQVSGPPGMLSAADYGLWWSNSFHFTKAQFLDRIIANFTKHGLPFTHLVMDDGWHQIQDGKDWASYTWNSSLPDYFGNTSDVQEFVQSLHSTAADSPLQRAMALSLNLHPIGVEPAELRYNPFQQQVGADPALKATLRCDLQNETWMTALFDQVLDAPPNSGVDSWWTDGTCDGGTYGGSWENQYAYAERIREYRELRGYTMSRWGGVGSQRSPMGFSGDQTTAWPTLKFQVDNTQTAANVMFNSWSHDIGGFDCCGGPQGGGIYGGCPFPTWTGCETNSSTDRGSQLLVRWLQYGALSAVDRTHCGGCNREFWTFPNFAAMSDAMHLRNVLFPYIYSENHFTRSTGVSLLHPVYYDAPHLDRAYNTSGSYLFGGAMLVAPIVEPIDSTAGQTRVNQTTWLPPGDWLPWSGAAVHSSGDSGLDVTAEYAVDALPMFVRTGAVVPLRTNHSLLQTVAFSDPLVWAVFVGTAKAAKVAGGSGVVVEDDGATLRHETHNATATTLMTWAMRSADELVLTVSATDGSFDVDGCAHAEAGWEYAGADVQELLDAADTGSAESCCAACGSFSNCAFWTFFPPSPSTEPPTATLPSNGQASEASSTRSRCALKVSRRGRRAHPSAVSGAAPRRMPTTRSHGFQLRSPRFAAAPPSAVTVNGQALRPIAPADAGEVGWFVQPAGAPTGLSRAPPGAVVILTPSAKLSEGFEVVVVAAGGRQSQFAQPP
jgi:alpha-glucosidase (family GH31 glycosyl hydrolase)